MTTIRVVGLAGQDDMAFQIDGGALLVWELASMVKEQTGIPRGEQALFLDNQQLSMQNQLQPREGLDYMVVALLRTQSLCAACGLSPEKKGVKKFQMCSGCKDSRYCSSVCQKAHWKLHRTACKKR